MIAGVTVPVLTDAAAMLGAAGLAAYRNTIVGHQAPIVAAYFERVTHPQIGDLVVETTSFGMREARGTAHEAVGFLVERDTGEDEWEIAPYAGGPTVRWGNAEFISIPTTAAQAREWARV